MEMECPVGITCVVPPMTPRSLLALALPLALTACPTRPSMMMTTEPPIPVADAGVVPSAPLTVTASIDASSIAVSWTLPTDASAATQVVIARATVPQLSSRPASTELIVIGSVAVAETRFVDPDVEPGLIYVYAAALRGPAGRSPFTVQPDAVTIALPTSACRRTPTSADADGDQLADMAETAGWTVIVNEDGQGTMGQRMVKSSPFNADTDGDGVCDDEESSLRLDPRQADTDGDGLSDFDEVNRWGSTPTNVDSDGDAKGNPVFYDGSELLTFRTSPTLADTDGDGRSDFDELNQDSTNALVAEIPQPALDVVGPMQVQLAMQLSNGTTVNNAYTQRLESGTSTALSQTSASATSKTVEESFSLSTSASVSYPFSASAEVTGTVSGRETYVQETSQSVSQSSARDSQQTYDTAVSDAVSNDKTITGGTLSLDFAVRNEGTRTFALSNVVVTALRRDRANPTTFTSIATLAFPMAANNLVLAEGQEAGPIRAEGTVTAGVALDLLANPDSVFFQAANFSLTDRTGAAFSFSIGEETTSRTALLTLDYGGARPLERHRVATNVERNAMGRAAGVKLGDVLRDVLGLRPGVGFETSPKAGMGARVLTRLRDVAARPAPDAGAARFWVVFASSNPDPNLPPVSQRLTNPAIDFEDLVLMPRDSVTIAFVGDDDRDGLFDREELVASTSDLVADTDSDGLTDFEEVRQGWTVAVDNAFYRANPRVFPSATSANADGDGFSDAQERTRGTDPRRIDTDGDGLRDDLDPEPAQGPRGTWVKTFGTAAAETTLQVLAQGDAVYVLGTSAGDIDGDSVAGGPFVLAIDATTGAQRWVRQFEGSVRFTRKVAFVSGQLRWVTDVTGGVVPGVTTPTMGLVSIDPMGVVSFLNLTNFGGTTGAYATSAIPPTSTGSLEPSGSGFAWVIAPYIQGNGNQGIHRREFLADAGAGQATTTSGGSSSDAYTLRGTSSNGRFVAFASDFRSSSCAGGGSVIEIGRAASVTGASVLSSCPSNNPRLVALDARGGVAVSLAGSTSDTVQVRPLIANMPIAWTFNPTTLVPGAVRVTGLEADDTNQYYVGLRSPASATAAFVLLNADGSVRDDLRFGNGTTQVNSSRRDPIGNLFVGGTTVGGFPMQAPMSFGGDDVLVIRNPQLLF
jgi:hypothetical protein